MRYDGTDKCDDFICNTLIDHFDLIPVCPEVGAGLGTPRPPVRLVGNPEYPQALGVDDADLNVTAALEAFAKRWLEQLENISGLILKARSPSCGLRDTPVFDHDGDIQVLEAGLFTRILMSHAPLLPMVDEVDINNLERRADFIAGVKAYNTQSVRSPMRK
ncbi:Uncharacterized protein YbbK [hydrothermal vent metagenome]|uniref:Uncharacterized protein YbbK n=1 Tax=hydrothermal vent metagenome TaxID=652676 RepID=A0A3B1B2A3_9ZZZZ